MILAGVRAAMELANIGFADTTLVAGGILHERSRLLIAGDAGVGKSYLLLQLAWEAASGEPWLGIWGVKRPLVTLEVQVEISEPLLKQRYLRLRHVMPDPAGLYLKTDEQFLLEDNERDLSDTIDSLGIELVVLDPLYLMHTGDENAVHTIRPTQQVIDRLRRRHGTTFVIAHHLRKTMPGERPSMNMLRGSSGWAGWVDTILLATPSQEGIKLHLLKARNRQARLPQTAYVLKWQEVGKFFKYDDNVVEDSLALIVTAIDEVGVDGVAKRADVKRWLEEEQGWSRASVYRDIDKLVRTGFVRLEDGMLKLKETL